MRFFYACRSDTTLLSMMQWREVRFGTCEALKNRTPILIK